MSERLLLGHSAPATQTPGETNGYTANGQESEERGASSLSLNLQAPYLTHCTHTSTMANSTRENKSLSTLSCTAGVCGSLGGRHGISSRFCCSEKAKNSWVYLAATLTDALPIFSYLTFTKLLHDDRYYALYREVSSRNTQSAIPFPSLLAIIHLHQDIKNVRTGNGGAHL